MNNKKIVEILNKALAEEITALLQYIQPIVGVDYKNCPSTWKTVKEQGANKALRTVFVKELKRGFSGLAKKS